VTGYELWRDRANGEIWAVRLVDGDVDGAFGPLSGSQVDRSCLPVHDYADGSFIQLHRERFALVSEADILLLSAESD
jgi:hypothetical protein